MIDARTGKLEETYRMGSTTWGAAASRDGKRLAISEFTPQLSLWDVATKRVLGVVGLPSTTNAMSVSPDGQYLVAVGSSGATVIRGRNPVLSVPGATSAWIDARNRVYCTVREGVRTTLNTYDLVRSPGSVVFPTKISTQSPPAVSDDGRLLYFGGDNAQITVFDRRTRKAVRIYSVRADQVTGVSHPAFVAANGSEDGKVYQVDRASGRAVPIPGAVCKSGDALTGVLQLDPAGSVLMTGDRTGAAGLFSLSDGHEVRLGGPAVYGTMARDGKMAYVCTRAGMLEIYSVPDGKRRRSWPIEGRGVTAMDVSADGQKIALGDQFGHVRIFDLATGAKLIDIAPYAGTVATVQFDQAGQRLLLAGDTSAKLIYLPTGSELLQLSDYNSVNSASFTPNEDAIVTAGWGELRIWSRRQLPEGAQ